MLLLLLLMMMMMMMMHCGGDRVTLADASHRTSLNGHYELNGFIT